MKKFGPWLFVLAVVIIPMSVFALVKWYEQEYTRLPVLGPKGHRIEDFRMINQRGAPVSLLDWEEKIVIADFFFTHCPVVCPRMTRSLKEVQQLYAGDQDILINSFSVDPERDSAGALSAYTNKMDIRNNWQLLTGDKKEIYRLARKSFLVVATDGDGGPNDFIHSELLVLIDREKKIRGYYNGTDKEDVKQLLRDIKRLKREY